MKTENQIIVTTIICYFLDQKLNYIFRVSTSSTFGSLLLRVYNGHNKNELE